MFASVRIQSIYTFCTGLATWEHFFLQVTEYRFEHHGLVQYLTLCASDNGLNDRSSFIVQQMHLINDEQLHSGCYCDIPSLSCDHVPLLWCCHDHLSLRHLALAQLHISCQLLHFHTCSNPQACPILALFLSVYPCMSQEWYGCQISLSYLSSTSNSIHDLNLQPEKYIIE